MYIYMNICYLQPLLVLGSTTEMQVCVKFGFVIQLHRVMYQLVLYSFSVRILIILTKIWYDTRRETRRKRGLL